MSERLTDDERGDLRPWDNLAYSCACLSEFCETVPCHNDRDDLYITVERIITARVQAAKAQALRDAAEAFATGEWVNAFLEHDVNDEESAVEATDVWLIERADRIAGDS